MQDIEQAPEKEGRGSAVRVQRADPAQERKAEIPGKEREVVTHRGQHRPMESPSKAPHSGDSPWTGLLITASILSCWIQPTSAQSDSFSVVPKPPYGTVGSSITLDIQGSSEQAPSYTWYGRTVGPSNQIVFYHVATGYHTTADNRKKIFSNSSLLISNLTLSDTDNYLVQFLNLRSILMVTARGHLAMYGKCCHAIIPSLVKGGATAGPGEEEGNKHLLHAYCVQAPC
ncbi:cell adhesion molecule CEACAM4-like [Phascolarctos cinereus]